MSGPPGSEGQVGAQGNPGEAGIRGPPGQEGPTGKTIDFTAEDRTIFKDITSRLSTAAYRAHLTESMANKALSTRMAALKKHFAGMKERLYLDEQQDKLTEMKILGMVSALKQAEAQENKTMAVVEQATATEQALSSQTAELKDQVLSNAEAAQAAIP